MEKIGVLLVGHGSREARANQEFAQFVEAFGRRPHGFEVSSAFIELASPSMTDAIQELAQLSAQVVVQPCFLFAAGHAKNDIPLAMARARKRFPNVRFVAARAFGVHPAMLTASFERLREVFDPERHDPARTAVVLVGRGASDPDANAEFCKLARLFGEGRNFAWTVPSFVGITRPLFEEALELVARARPERIVALPYMLFGGRLVARLEEQARSFARRYPWISVDVASHLGAHEKLFELLEQRIREALDGSAPLPCDTCQYRSAIGAISDQVGGLRSLLWSARHMVTHSQGMPHAHAHRPLTKHILVCGSVDCAARGSIGLITALRGELRRAGRNREIRVTKTSCMGRCGEGPTIAVYPDGIWYRSVTKDDAGELVRQHLLGDQLVSRLIDAIMQ